MKQGKVVVGTFHKTGTVLIQSILRIASKRVGFKLWNMHADPEPAEWDVGFHSHSRFTGEVLGQIHRGAIVIRDPRDVVISAAHYHTKSAEKWLHRRQAKYNDMTYQQKINSLPTLDERLVFEMNNSAANTIRGMTHVAEHLPNFKLVKYESLVGDHELTEFEELFRWLGFAEQDLPQLKEIARRRSLFGGKVQNSVHVRSGAPEQWKAAFSPRVLRAFVDRHGDAAEKLGYAPSDESLLVAPAAA